MLLRTFCYSMPSFLPHDFKKMYGSMTFGFFTWPVAIGSRLKPSGIFWFLYVHHALQGTPRVEARGGRNVHLTLFSLERILCRHGCN